MVRRCPQGHLYNPSKVKSCPLCSVHREKVRILKTVKKIKSLHCRWRECHERFDKNRGQKFCSEACKEKGDHARYLIEKEKRNQHRKLVPEGMCNIAHCKDPSAVGKKCLRHNTTAKKASQDYHDRNRDRGKCVKCRKPPLPGKTVCFKHANRKTEEELLKFAVCQRCTAVFYYSWSGVPKFCDPCKPIADKIRHLANGKIRRLRMKQERLCPNPNLPTQSEISSTS